MKICSSRFDAYAEVYSDDGSDDGAGGLTNTRTVKTTINVMVDESNAAENLDRDGLETQRRVVFYTHYRTDLNTKDRISLDSQNYNITSITRVDANGKAKYRGKYLRIDTDQAQWFGV